MDPAIALRVGIPALAQCRPPNILLAACLGAVRLIPCHRGPASPALKSRAEDTKTMGKMVDEGKCKEDLYY